MLEYDDDDGAHVTDFEEVVMLGSIIGGNMVYLAAQRIKQYGERYVEFQVSTGPEWYTVGSLQECQGWYLASAEPTPDSSTIRAVVDRMQEALQLYMGAETETGKASVLRPDFLKGVPPPELED